MPPLRICLLGTGQASASHSKTLRSLPVTVEIASRTQGGADDFASRHGLRTRHGSYEAAFASEPDIVVIATPPSSHAELMHLALQSDVHLLVEKPMVHQLDELEKLWSDLIGHDRLVMVAENQHFAPQHAELARLIRSGVIGDPQLVHLNRLIRSPQRTWRSDPAEMRGALHEAGIHWVRRLLALTELFNEAPASDLLGVYAAQPTTHVTDTPGDETVLVVGRHASGAVSQLSHSWGIPNRTGLLDLSKVVGSHGAIYFDLRGRGGVVFRGQSPRPAAVLRPVRDDRNGYAAMWTHVLDCVQSGRAPSLTLDQTWRDLAYVEAAYDSLESRGEEAPRATPAAEVPTGAPVPIRATRPSLSDTDLVQFRETGFVGPFPLLKPEDFDEIVADYLDTIEQVGWYKALHEIDSACYRAAARPEVVGRVASILGEDLLLWATQVMSKPPGADHRWHVDIETIAWKSVNVWVAMHNVTANSTIQFIPGSHHYGPAPQDLARDEPIDLGDAEDVCRVARRFDPAARVETVILDPGEFVIFDGHLWHGSVNTTGQRRTALLAQYSPPDCDIRQPATFEEPIEWKAERPATVLVSGRDSVGLNRVVEPRPLSRPPAHRRLVRRLRHR